MAPTLARMPIGKFPFEMTVEKDGMVELRCGTAVILTLRDTEHGISETPWWVALTPGGDPAFAKNTKPERYATAWACVQGWFKAHGIKDSAA